MEYKFNPKGVCSMQMIVNIDGNIIKSVKIIGGCPGNSLGVASLVAGMTVDEAIKRLKGIDCRGRGTSCPDQLARGLEEIKNSREISQV